MQSGVVAGRETPPESRRQRRAGGEVVPFSETRVPPALRVPRWLAKTVASGIAAATVAGLLRGRAPVPLRILRAILYGSASAWLATTTLDLAEHLRLEKEAAGRYLGSVAVPLGESAVHAAILATNVSALALARPFRRVPGPRELWLLCAPAIFLGLGWGDEIGYHRSRATHREDLIHTTEHLAEGVMWTSLYAARLIRWG